MGDLNAAWNSSRASHALTAWAEDSGWFNRIYQIANAHNFPIHTFRSKGEPVSWIDHILSYGEAGNISLQQAQAPSGSFFIGISDHTPIIASFFLHGGPRLPKFLRPPSPTSKKRPININLNDKKQVKKIHAHLMEWLDKHPPDHRATPEEAVDYLLSMTQASVEAISNIVHNDRSYTVHKHKYYLGGWSPTLISLKAHLQALLLIQRHSTSKKSKWRSQLEATCDITAIVNCWEKRVLSFDEWPTAEAPYLLMDHTGYGPSYWRTLATFPSAALLQSEITSIKKRLHGRQRTELRLLINHAVAKRERAIEMGRFNNHLRSLLGERRPFVDLDTLQLDQSTLLTNSMEVHHQITAHFNRWYSTPPNQHPQSIHHPSFDWTQLG